jgi:hypothetical protein
MAAPPRAARGITIVPFCLSGPRLQFKIGNRPVPKP